jgi:CheY-like chemotaxis protein
MTRMPRPRVLIINTDPAVHDVVEAAGYQVSLLSHFNHDLLEIKRVSPDLIVLDYRWSGDDNGWSLLHLLLLAPGTVAIPLVLCTAAARELEDLNGHLTTVRVIGVVKPFAAGTLLAAIADALAGIESPVTVTSI